MHKSNGGFGFWDSEKEKVISMYLDKKMSTNDIGKIYGCYGTTVLLHLKRWNVEIRKERYNSKYSVDVLCFDAIDDEYKAYFLGLLLADGHISKHNTIMLTMKDADVVEKWKSFLNTDAPIKIDKHGNYYLNIVCKRIADRLKEIGFNNRKSYHVDFDRIIGNVPESLMHHFLRGLFDGDGSIRIYNYPYLKKPQLHFGITGLPNVVQFFKEYLGITTKTVKESDITHTCVSACRETIIKSFKTLYKDATVYMERKYETFKSIV